METRLEHVKRLVILAATSVLLAALLGACAKDRPADRASEPSATVRDTAHAPAAAIPIAAPIAEDTSFFTRFVGIAAYARDYPHCLVIANGGLQPGAPLVVVSTTLPQRVHSAVVLAKRGKACTEPGDEWGDAEIDNASYYNIQFTDSVESGPPTVALAIPNVAVSVQDSVVVGDLDGDGKPEHFKECTSHEGTHYFVFTGDVRRWHVYYYVPYDLEPDCTESLFTGLPR